MADRFDIDIHGVIRVRLVDPSPADLVAHTRHLGPADPAGGDDGEADLTVRFVERLALGPMVRHLGPTVAEADDEGFILVRRQDRGDRRVRLPLDRVGRPAEVVAERGLGAVPFLAHLVNLVALDKGLLPLHGTAFRAPSGLGIVTTGWSKGGKTEALLAFADRGATYGGDEWLLVDPVGGPVRGFARPIRVWDSHLSDLPGYRRRLGWRERGRLTATRWVMTAADAGAAGAGTAVGPTFDRLARVVERRRFVEPPPSVLFDDAPAHPSTPFDRLFLMTSTTDPATTVTPIDPLEVADRMWASLQHERLELLVCYHQFRFAFPEPERANPVLETAPDRERELLRQAFAGKPAFEVTHPHPASLPALHETMAPYC